RRRRGRHPDGRAAGRDPAEDRLMPETAESHNGAVRPRGGVWGGRPPEEAGADLRSRVAAWIAQDPAERDRARLTARRAADGADAEAELADRFAGRLEFGTAGLRGIVAAGPNRMNCAVVRATTAALAGWLRSRDPEAVTRGVVIGCDARHRSDEF